MHLVVRGPLARQDLPGLCDRACRMLAGAGGAATVICDVRDVAADAVAVDALARLQLAARGRGCEVRLRNASSALWELIAFVGLGDVLPAG